jgi:hypothetical protein
MLSQANRFLLRKLARDAIKFGLQHHAEMPVDLDTLPAAVTRPRASFVTLYIAGSLKGCIGTLEAYRPLALDVAANAYAAAFRDSRFTPVTSAIVDDLDIHISILSEPEEMSCTSEQSLLNQLKPGVDGLIIEDAHHRATFLPTVWDALPSAERFVRALKQKAGLAEDFWSPDIHCYRYHTESF